MNKNITLKPMTRTLCHRLFQNFRSDPDVFRDDQPVTEYRYTPEGCNAYYDRQKALDRIHLGIMLQDQIIGEIILKNIDHEQASCRLSIHLMNDSVKNRGFGTAAEILALEFAFAKEQIKTVYADALVKNTRSRHVLEKAGFRETGNDGTYSYYVCARP